MLLTWCINMNVDVAKRVMACNRQIAAIKAAFKRGEITDAERDILVEPLVAEISVVRAQASLPLKTTDGDAKRK